MWRVCVFAKALRSQDEVVRAASVRAFPVLLHHLGKSHHNLISTTLLCVNSMEAIYKCGAFVVIIDKSLLRFV